MEIFNYLIQFLLGGIIFTLLYYFSKKNNTIVSSIIPTIPFVFYVGIFYIIAFKGKYESYVKNCIFTFTLNVIFMIFLYYIITYYDFNIYLALIISTLIFLMSIILLVNCKILE